MSPFEFPDLRTLRELPSWCNLRGHLDRSACIEIRVSEARRLAGCMHVDPYKRDSRGRALHTTAPLPDERNAGKRFADGSRRLTTGTFTLTSHQLNWLHGTRQPRTLAGDFRTNRANVMRSENRRIHHGGHGEHGGRNGLCSSNSNDHNKGGARRRFAQHPSSVSFATANLRSVISVVKNSGKKKGQFRTRITRANPFAFPPDRGLNGNPNKGASRTKKIGLQYEWSQLLRIEKWQYPRRIRPVYFLVCPGHDRSIHRGELGERGERNRLCSSNSSDRNNSGACRRSNPNLSSALSASSAVNPVPPLSTRKPGREHPSSRRCPQRCLKLLMVQCTEQENRDAETAQRWIESLPPLLAKTPNYREHINLLHERYGPIFEPRTLLCPRCLGVKYGNNPETVRQGWRRRNKKADTTVTGNLDRIIVELNHFNREEYFRGREFIEGVPPRDHRWAKDPEAWHQKKKERQKARRREYDREYNRKNLRTQRPTRKAEA